MSGPQNAQDFIRALKAATDPPQAGGPLKIEIARQAWDNTSMYVPNKAEAIVEWLLSIMLKDKSRPPYNPLYDSRFWGLLSDVLCVPHAARASDHGRAIRAWMVPLLNRIPISPIVLSYLEAYHSGCRDAVFGFEIAARCIAVLWPLAAPKFNPETLLESFGAVIRLGASANAPVSPFNLPQTLDVSRALTAIVSSYRSCLANWAAKRKHLYTLFLGRHLSSWLQFVSQHREGEVGTLIADIYDAGIETMFGLETMKQAAADHKHDATLSEALMAVPPDCFEAVLRSLPMLFGSYVQSIKRHKNAIFSQGSSHAASHIAEQVQRAAMSLYADCISFARKVDDLPSWECRVLLLEVVERDNLVNAADEDSQALLGQERDSALQTLGDSWNEQYAQRNDCAVKLLASLTRLDYDSTSPSFALVLPKMVAMHRNVPSATQFLKLLVEYDSKTRSIPSFIGHVCEAFSSRRLQRIPGGAKAAYRIACNGPLTSITFYDELARAVHNFLTPGQVLGAIQYVAQRLEDAYTGFLDGAARRAADSGDGARKRRKKDRDRDAHEESGEDDGHLAVSFVLVARTAAAVLRAIPLHTLTEDVRAEAERAILGVHAAVVGRALADGFGTGQGGRRESWSWQLVLAGALRLHYSLALTHGLPTQPPLEQEIAEVTLSCVEDEGVIPELVVEVLRTLMHHCTTSTFDHSSLFEQSLNYLAAHLPNAENTWSGKAHLLESHSTGAVAALQLLVDRWLPEFDAWASIPQLQRLCRLLISSDLSSFSAGTQAMSLRSILVTTLHDAQFWEMSRLQDSFLTVLNEQTVSLDEIDLAKTVASLSAKSSRLPADAIQSITSAYNVLALTPLEYIPRSMHLAFLKRGFAADAALLSTLRYAKKVRVSESQLVVVREVLCRSMAYLDTIESLADSVYWPYVLASDQGVADNTSGLTSVTKDLIDMYQGSLLRSAKRAPEPLTALASKYAQGFTSRTPSMSERAALLLVDSIVQGVPASSLPTQCVDGIHALHTSMVKFTTMVSSGTSTGSIPFNEYSLDVWSHVRILGHWLGLEADRLPQISRKLAERLLSHSNDMQQTVALAPMIVSILFGEINALDSEHTGEHIEYVVVTYIALVRICGLPALSGLDTRLATACKALPTSAFAAMLDVVYEELPTQGKLGPEDVSSLVHFSALLLHDAPEGTSKTCQAFATKCLNLFADDRRFIDIPAVRHEALDFVFMQCSDRPASLRTADLSGIWSFIGALLSGSQTHDASTDLAVFHGIVNTLSALVRLRRDLLLQTLPHLGQSLRQLVACLRAPRPQLGGKQSRLVMDSLPRWVAAPPPSSTSASSTSAPIGAAESKALARLLTTLTTKTLVRAPQREQQQGQQQPASLARPFARHAAYVLTAYAGAVADPLCVLAAPVRRELLPGLCALCEMLGEHSRDAVMAAALDAGGKAAMKALWREYEKQRYVGKG
ncbi:Urb2/Npa2 family-domain-containing protein [Epithele typhae]|uniref:Urb2/Npa2 family-domain-containing protein n=1 Tax=Epithele typhae TaxID=378194 RepID=UPI0020079E83|nr:Urb2/Npa2 family-domain-containing protein [Epithele typhae]KAH9921960.1 Urb2/Npa2 family-domain-containing protein [Epithele typhae]